MTFSKSPPAISAAFAVLLVILGAKIFWPNSSPLEMLIQKNWNQLISSFRGNPDWHLASHQPPHARNSPKTWSSLTSWTPNCFFRGVSGNHGFQCFPSRMVLKSWPAHSQSSQPHLLAHPLHRKQQPAEVTPNPRAQEAASWEVLMPRWWQI